MGRIFNHRNGQLESDIFDRDEKIKELESQLREARSYLELQVSIMDSRNEEIKRLNSDLVAAKAEIDGFKERDKNQVSIMKTYRNAALSLQSENKRLRQSLEAIQFGSLEANFKQCLQTPQDIAKDALSPEK